MSHLKINRPHTKVIAMRRTPTRRLFDSRQPPEDAQDLDRHIVSPWLLTALTPWSMDWFKGKSTGHHRFSH